MLTDDLSWLDEEVSVIEDLFAVGQIILFAIVEVVVKIDHFFVCLVQLGLVVLIEVVLGKFKLANLILYFIQLLVNNIGISIVLLRDVLNTLLKIPLVLHDYLALVLIILELLFVLAVLTLLPLVHLLLVLIVVCKHLLDGFEVLS